MYLLGTSTSYIISPPPKITVGCGPEPHLNKKWGTGTGHRKIITSRSWNFLGYRNLRKEV